MNPGKRRTAREMAVQMLYQSDLGGSPLPQIFTSFDIAQYMAREEAAREEEAGTPPSTPSAPNAPRAPRASADGPDEKADYARRRRRVEDAFHFAQELVRGTLEHQEQIDGMIRGQADNWRLERMPPVDRNVLRLAIYEMLFETDTPKLVVMDEAIELAKKFGSEQSGRFVNGLLDGLLKQHTFPGSLT
jgi:transcription antitermination factor NusB